MTSLKLYLARLRPKSFRFLPQIDLLPYQLYSPLDAEMERISYDCVEEIFADRQAIQGTCSVFSTFLQDDEGTRLLKKAFQCEYERRLRCLALLADPATDYHFDALQTDFRPHPLDVIAISHIRNKCSDFALSTPRISLTMKIADRLSIIAEALKLVFRAISVTLSQVGHRPSSHKTDILAANFWSRDRYELILDAADRLGRPLRQRLTFFMSRRENQDVRHLGEGIIDPASLKIGLQTCITTILRPCAYLALRLVVNAFLPNRDPSDREVVRQALRHAGYAINYLIVAQSVKFRIWIDTGEYSALPNLQTSIFSKVPAKNVRWPLSQIDSWGSVMTYLPYDIFFSGGDYEVEHFSRSWRPRFKHYPVGSLQFDSTRQGPARIAEGFRQRLTNWGKRPAGRIVFFGTSLVDGLTPVIKESLLVVCKSVRDAEGWSLVIKPKRSHSLQSLVSSDSRFAEFIDHPDIIWLEESDKDKDVCPSGWLIDNMDLGAGDPGSVLAESLGRGKPFIAYYPILAQTPLRNMMHEDGFIHDNLEGFADTISKTMASSDTLPKPANRYKTAFDPFQDNRSMERIVNVLLDAITERPGQVANTSNHK